MRILAQFLLFLLWITDAYLNPPWTIHQIDTERYVVEKKDSHNEFYLHNGTNTKHLGFGKVAVHLTLTSNPKRKNKSPAGRLDRRTIILLFLLLSGDVEINPGPLPIQQPMTGPLPSQQPMTGPLPTQQPTTEMFHHGKVDYLTLGNVNDISSALWLQSYFCRIIISIV